MVNFIKADIRTAPQGYTMVSAFPANLDCGAGINKVMDEMFDITNRQEAIKEFKSGNLKRLDNLYMLIVKETSYDAPDWNRLKTALKEFKTKCEKFGIRKIAMPLICTGKNGGFAVDDVFGLIDDIFDDADVNILIYIRD